MSWPRALHVFAIGRHPYERGYTAIVGSWKCRAVSLAMIVALAGNPAVLAACAALCMPDMLHGRSMATADEADPHATHGSIPTSHATTDESDTQAPGHHHSPAQESEGSGRASGEGVIEVAAASDRSCCTSNDSILTASVAAVRADTGVLLATAAVFATPFQSLIPVRSETTTSPPVAPPSPTRAPLVLRV